MSETVLERLLKADALLHDAELEATHGQTANPQLIDQRVEQARAQVLAALQILHSQASDEGKP